MSKCDKNPLPLKKPEIKKYGSDDWIIYEDSIPRPLEHPRTCTDTINSACGTGKSIEKCIHECDASEMCSFGYHLKYNDNSSVCLPIYTSDYYPNSNPTYALKNQDCYDLPPGVTSNTFISKKRWGNNGILPNEANAVFFDDIVLLGHRLKSDNTFLKLGSNGKISFEEFEGTKLKLLPEYGAGLKSTVEYYDHISFNMVMDNDTFTSNVLVVIPDNLSKTYTTDDNIIFKPYKNTFLSPEQKFTIIPVPNMNDSKFNYDSKFLLKTNEGFLQKTKKTKTNISKLVVNTAVNSLHNLSSIVSEKFDISSMIFNFHPTKKIYTCDNGKCTEHQLTDAKRLNRTAHLNGNIAYTRSDCFGSCKWGSDTQHSMSNTDTRLVLGGDIQTINECDNNWCIALTTVLVILIMLSIIILW